MSDNRLYWCCGVVLAGIVDKRNFEAAADIFSFAIVLMFAGAIITTLISDNPPEGE